MSKPPFIHLQSIDKTYRLQIQALQNISMEITEGEFVSFLGPSGCGKSTLLRLLAGLEAPSFGHLELRVNRSEMAYVFQDPHLLPWRNLLENVILPLELRRHPRLEAESRAFEILDSLGLREFTKAYPDELSGGMRMRASLARALIAQPQVLLLDEPFAALDEMTRSRLDEDLRKLWTERRITILFVTHSVAEAAFLSNRALVFSKRPGRILLDHRFENAHKRDQAYRLSEDCLKTQRILLEALEK